MTRFVVFGKPQPQGSSRAFINKRTGKIAVTSANKNLKSWRQELSLTALSAMRQRMEGRIKLTVTFFLAKPRSVKRECPTVKPDLDKLLRAVCDGLTGIAFQDDAQVCEAICKKEYATDSPERTEIILEAR